MMPLKINDLYKKREAFSKKRLNDLCSNINSSIHSSTYPGLTIIGAGSYARYEASEYSDVDMFFLCASERDSIQEPRTAELKLFSKLIDIIEKMSLPKFSNDCQYLTILHTNEIIDHLGGPQDDHKNFFTARMLLLLESKCLYGDDIYKKVIADIIDSYFQDFPDHKDTFQPIFLMNDICRYWKTLLLNYESKRSRNPDPQKKVKQKVRNFKLKYSRMTTCFASIAALGCCDSPITKDQVIEITSLTPRERLQYITKHVKETISPVQKIFDEYCWFLEKTGLPVEELEDHFRDSENLKKMFERANLYGDLMFDLIKVLDNHNNNNNNLMRYLVI